MGDPMASMHKRFEAMVKALSGDLYRYAFWLCGNRAMAEDLVQETLMRGWRAFSSLRDETKALAWLITTVRREHARVRERHKMSYMDIDLDTIPDERASVERSPSSDVWDMRRAIAALPQKYREPLVLQVVGGYRGEEISQMLDVPLATVNTRLFRARQRLRDQLDEEVRATRPKRQVN